MRKSKGRRLGLLRMPRVKRQPACMRCCDLRGSRSMHPLEPTSNDASAATFPEVRVHTNASAGQSARGNRCPRVHRWTKYRLVQGDTCRVTLKGIASSHTSSRTSVQQASPSPAVPQLSRQVQRSPRKIRTTAEIDREAAPLVKDMANARSIIGRNRLIGAYNSLSIWNWRSGIDLLRSKGLTTTAFLETLLGNVIWATACFLG